MKWLIFKLLLFILPWSGTLNAQEDTTPYEARAKKYSERWNNLRPSHMKLQYAGSMGLVSFGTGWDYGKNNQWETDLMFGFIPKYTTDNVKVCITLKQNFIPWAIQLKESDFIWTH